MSTSSRRENPYTSLPDRHYWRPAVANRGLLEIDDLWTPKFEITDQSAISTYGSCFAQHIGQALRARGFNWFVTENAPGPLSPEQAKLFNFNVFSSRTGNIYTTSLLRQWVSWADGKAKPPTEIWQDGDRVYDPFRPAIEPNGFADEDEILRTREATISAFARSISNADILVFTLGLTESWINARGGYEYPMCPGTHAGTFDGDVHKFVNQDFPTVEANLRAALDAMRRMNPNLRFLLTVSPVPLTATYSNDHVLVATMYSKSVLRAVAGHFAKTMEDVDYFPSYEIVNSPPFRGSFFQANQRNMAPRGVDFVMEHFFAGVEKTAPLDAGVVSSQHSVQTDVAGEVCEEALLEAFSSGAPKARGGEG